MKTIAIIKNGEVKGILKFPDNAVLNAGTGRIIENITAKPQVKIGWRYDDGEFVDPEY